MVIERLLKSLDRRDSWRSSRVVSESSSGSVDYAYLYTAADERVAVEERSFWGSSVVVTLRDLDGLVLREYLDSASDTVMTDGFESGDLACWSAVEGGPPVGGGCPKAGLTWRRDHIYRDGQLLACRHPPHPSAGVVWRCGHADA